MERNEILARPNQRLSTHIGNMIKAFNEYSTNSKIFSEELKIIIYQMIIFHDVGKLNPYFQEKIRNNLEKKIGRELTYHTQLSTFIFCLFIKYYLNVEFSNSKKQIKELYNSAIYAVFFHHEKTLNNYSDIETPKYMNQFTEVLKRIDKKRIVDFLEYQFYNLNDKYNIGAKESWINALKKLLKFLSELDKMDNMKLMQRNIPKIWKNLINSKEINFHYTVKFLSSLLFDLDEWDARFYTSDDNEHDFPFRIKFKPSKGDLVSKYCDDEFGDYEIQENDDILLKLRKSLRKEIEQIQDSQYEKYIGKILTMNAPTGAGKTLCLLNTAVRLQEEYYKHYGITPKVIYALPFVSLGLQIAENIMDVMGIKEKEERKVQDRELIVHNYLTPLKFKYENEKNQENTQKYIDGRDAKWFIRNWHSKFIVTTFVQIFNTLFKNPKSIWKRYHRFRDSIIILDEIQTIPVKYWDLVAKTLDDLSKNFNSTIILSTATMPKLFTNKNIFNPSKRIINISKGLKDQDFLDDLNRYKIYWKKDITKLEDLESELEDKFNSEDQHQHTMIVLNTKQTAKRVFDFLRKEAKIPNLAKNYSLYLLSGLVLPIHREQILDEILSQLDNHKKEKKVLLICTQLIEAGIDVSFQRVYRDLAPLDSIVQVAGRCNRGMEYNKIGGGKMYIVNLIYKKLDRRFAEMVYQNCEVDLEITEQCLDEILEKNDGKYFNETDIRRKFSDYYRDLRPYKETKKGIEEYEDLKFDKLAKKFNLITQYKDYVNLFLSIDDDSQQILEKLTKNGDSRKSVPRNFYQYLISVNKKKIKGKVIKKREIPKGPEFFLLKNPSKTYNKEGGLDISE